MMVSSLLRLTPVHKEHGAKKHQCSSCMHAAHNKSSLHISAYTQKKNTPPLTAASVSMFTSPSKAGKSLACIRQTISTVRNGIRLREIFHVCSRCQILLRKPTDVSTWEGSPSWSTDSEVESCRQNGFIVFIWKWWYKIRWTNAC